MYEVDLLKGLPPIVIDPALQDAWTPFDAKMHSDGEALEAFNNMLGSIERYQGRSIIDDHPGMDAEGRDFWRACHKLGTAALQASDTQFSNASGHTLMHKMLGNVDVVTSALTFSLVKPTQAIAIQPTDALDVEARVTLLEWAQNLHPDAQAKPTFSREAAQQLLEPYAKLRSAGSDMVEHLDSFAVLHRVAGLIDQLPSQDVLETFAGVAYYDTVRAVIGVGGSKMGGLIPPADRQFLRDNGLSDTMITLYEAASILDIATVPTGTMARDISYLQVLKALTGENAGLWRTALKAVHPNTDINKLAPAAQLVFNAHEIMKAVRMALPVREAISYIVQAEEPSLSHTIVRDTIRLARTLPNADAALSERLEARLAQNSVDDSLAVQAAAIETVKITHLRDYLEKLIALGVVPAGDLRALEPLFEPRLQTRLTDFRNAEMAAARQEYIDAVVAQLQTLEEPYHYTARRIRSYKDGTTFVRELQTQLIAREESLDEPTIQSLAILISQSEIARDPGAYFDAINAVRPVMEQLLDNLAAVGASNAYRSGLVNSMNWVDEIINAGRDTSIGNRRLEQFIYAYAVGPEAPATEPETIVDVTETLPPVVELPPRSSLTPKQRTERLKAAEVYTATLAEILQTVSIQHADIDAFPPGKTERRYTRLTKRAEATPVDIDPARLVNLVRLKSRFESMGKHVELSFTNPTSWSPIPPFVLYVQNKAGDSNGVCVVDNPVVGKASHAYPVDGILVQNLEELMKLSLSEARNFQLQSFTHPPKGSATFNQHYDLRLFGHINLLLSDLAIG